MSSNWKKIYSYNTGDNPLRTIGVDQDGQFVIESPPKLTALKEPKDYVALLTVLETDRGQFEQALREKNIEKEKTNKLKSELYKCGLTVSPYWTELVINWIEPEDINEELKKFLRPTISDTRVNQQLRHRVRTLIKE
jgi:hypothetical protein